MTNKSHKGNFEKFSRSRHYKQDKVREMTRKADRTFHHRRRKNMKRDIKKMANPKGLKNRHHVCKKEGTISGPVGVWNI